MFELHCVLNVDLMLKLSVKDWAKDEILYTTVRSLRIIKAFLVHMASIRQPLLLD